MKPGFPEVPGSSTQAHGSSVVRLALAKPLPPNIAEVPLAEALQASPPPMASVAVGLHRVIRPVRPVQSVERNP